MADVLIEGIRLPDYGKITVELQAGGNVRYVDAYGEFKYGKATTIPTHGRLIDADKFYEDVTESAIMTDDFKEAFAMWLETQETVIPAEPPKEET